MYLCKSHSWQYFPLSFLRTDISDPLEGSDWSLEGLQLLLRSQQYSLEPASLLDVSVRLQGTVVGFTVVLWAVNQTDTQTMLLVLLWHLICHMLPLPYFDLLERTGKISDFKWCFFAFVLKIHVWTLRSTKHSAFDGDINTRPNTFM